MKNFRKDLLKQIRLYSEKSTMGLKNGNKKPGRTSKLC